MRFSRKSKISEQNNRSFLVRRLSIIGMLAAAVFLFGWTLTAGATGEYPFPGVAGDRGVFAPSTVVTEVAKLTSSDLQAFDELGEAVAIDGDTIVVGSWREAGGPGDPGPFSGAAYVFERSEGGPANWGEVIKLAPSEIRLDDRFGRAVAISGDTIVVGAYRKDEAPLTTSGAAYVFERNAALNSCLFGLKFYFRFFSRSICHDTSHQSPCFVTGFGRAG
jgi:hypothetical protein